MAPRNLTHEDPLRRIQSSTSLKKKLDLDILNAIADARAEGRSWGEIAQRMDKSRSNARQWYMRHKEPAGADK